jgi:hypothetical protein
MGKNVQLIFLFGWLSTCSFAQVLEGIGKKVEEGAKNKSNEFNSTRSNKEKSQEQKRKTNSLSAPPPAPSSAPVPPPAESESPVEAPAAVDNQVQETYVFTHKVTYHFEDWDPDMKNEVAGKQVNALKNYEVTTHYADDATLMADEGTNTILDFANKLMITLDEQGKTAMVLSLDGTGAYPAEKEKPAGKPEVVRTGRQKVILGNTCDEYIIKEKDGAVTELWMASRITEYPKLLSGYVEMIGGQEDARSNGLMLEMTSRNKMGARKTHMLMTEYQEEAYQVDLSDYTVTNE